MSSKINETVLTIASQINPMLSLAVGIMKTVREIRAAAAEAAPHLLEDGTLAKSDAELIEKFLTESGLLKAESEDLLAWLRAQEPEP